ncbi:hypothetical protein FHX51_000713 [Aeriscardovia aeriphila]|uniref:Uncharacterized protein n=1 Tax=Aeriscardovia aeriphila TaxID=218139 RepID=A0A261FAL5_9BIFI|nr:hypothetical protein [Aeriscardovia aeriphila]OZG56085.1 hypothetical protein AEAE_0573 [Aeriscardovia aeriphila]
MHMAQKLSLLGHFLCVISYTRELLNSLSVLPFTALQALSLFLALTVLSYPAHVQLPQAM